MSPVFDSRALAGRCGIAVDLTGVFHASTFVTGQPIVVDGGYTA